MPLNRESRGHGHKERDGVRGADFESGGHPPRGEGLGESGTLAMKLEVKPAAGGGREGEGTGAVAEVTWWDVADPPCLWHCMQ